MNLRPNQYYINSIDTFIDLYDKQLKLKKGCLVAFDAASNEFREAHGFHPFSGFDDFLSELFSRNGGFQILNKSIS